MAVGQLRASGDEGDVQLVDPKLHDRFAGCAFGDLDLDAGMSFPILRDQFGEETARNEGMDADPKPATLARRRHASGFHGIVELIDANRYPFDEKAPGLGQPDASCASLEQADTKILLQRPDSRADAGLANAECLCSTVKAQIFGDSECG